MDREPSEQSEVSRRNFLWLAGAAAGAAALGGCSSLEHRPDPNFITHFAPPPGSETPTTPPPAKTTPNQLSRETDTPAPTPQKTTPTPEPTQTSRTAKTKTTLRPTSPENPKAALPDDHYILYAPRNKPNVCITVDDFSNSAAPKYLKGLLDLGDKKDTHFTFFPIGKALQNLDSRATRHLWRQAAESGHVIGNHTWDHDEHLGTASKRHIKRELAKQQATLDKIMGNDYDQYLMRPPGGSGGYRVADPKNKTERRLEHQFEHTRDTVKDLGYWLTMWNIDSNDQQNRMVTPGDSPRQQDVRFLHKIFRGAPDGSSEKVDNGDIILVHPTTLTLDGMSRLVDGLHDRNFTCTSIPEAFSLAS
jgi:peptidoglycan/xylan/chitin deacetylase (PgdA/CDA1 family)